MSEQRSLNLEVMGLLPHELKYVRKGLGAAALTQAEADQIYKDAVENSGGDWAFDDSASKAAAEAAHAADLRVNRQLILSRLHIAEYPSLNSRQVEIGSRVKLTVEDWEDTYDIVSRIIAGMPVAEGVELLSAQSPLGVVLMGKEVSNNVEWSVPSGKLVGKIEHVDQVAQREFYERILGNEHN